MAQPTIQGASAVAATSITLPAHAVGDLIILFAYRDGATTVPTKPAASGTVPAWVDIDAAAGANLNSARSAYFVATATNHTSGTWTNASAMVAVVLRGQNATPIGAHSVSTGAVATGGSLTTTALTSPTLDGTSQFLYFFGWRTVTAWSAAPTGYTQQAQQATNVEVLSKDDTTAEAAFGPTGTATASGGFRTNAIEIQGTATGPNTVAFASAVAGTSTITPDLIASRAIASTPAGTSTVTSQLLTSRRLASTVAGTSTVAGNVRTTRALATVVVGTSAIAANFRTTRALATSVAGTATIAADLTKGGFKALAVAITGTAIIAAAIRTTARFASSVAGSSAVSPALSIIGTPTVTTVFQTALQWRRRRLAHAGRQDTKRRRG